MITEQEQLDNGFIFNELARHGLSVRQIPEEVVERFHFVKKESELASNESIVKTLVNKDNVFDYETLKASHSGNNRFEFDDSESKIYRLDLKRVTIPKHAGYWMCKKSPSNTSSSMNWNKEEDNLAPSLKKSIELFLSKQSDEK